MIRFNMVKISIKQFAIVSEIGSDADKIGMELGFNVNYSMNMHRIGVSPMITLLGENSQKLLILELFCEFDIHPDDWGKMIDGKKLVIPKGFLGYLISQSVGTLRGVLYCKTEDTPYSIFLLPSINVSEMVQNDAEFELE